MRVLIVDDEVDIREFVQYNLAKEGHEVACAENGEEAVEVALRFRPHLVLMDMMMPVMDGKEACRKLRSMAEFDTTRILFLSAVREEDSLVDCYEAGADDYITKPVSMRVLCSRVNAIKRRIEEQKTSPILATSKLLDEHRAYRSDEGDITLAAKEYEILRLLTSEDRIFTREEIYNAVWGESVVVGGRTLDVHIRHLRSKIGEEKIMTCKGVGYKFCQ